MNLDTSMIKRESLSTNGFGFKMSIFFMSEAWVLHPFPSFVSFFMACLGENRNAEHI